MKHKVFICYKQRTAKDFAISLWEGLEEFNISAFLDIKNIPKRFKGTDKWWKCRDQAVIGCNTFLMIVTRGFEKSLEIQKEISLAYNGEKKFMCLRRSNLSSDITIRFLER